MDPVRITLYFIFTFGLFRNFVVTFFSGLNYPSWLLGVLRGSMRIFLLMWILKAIILDALTQGQFTVGGGTDRCVACIEKNPIYLSRHCLFFFLSFLLSLSFPLCFSYYFIFPSLFYFFLSSFFLIIMSKKNASHCIILHFA
jgi:hypothetical protein